MKLALSILSLLLVQSLSQANTLSSPLQQAEGEVCDTYITHTLPALQDALITMESLQHILHTVDAVKAQVADPIFCTSGLVLGRNIYQYFEVYFRIRVVSVSTGLERFDFRFVFQNASIQAYHNNTQQPWVGLSYKNADQVFAQLNDQAVFLPFPGITQMSLEQIALLSTTYKQNAATADLSTLSSIQLNIPQFVSSAPNVYLVSWMSLPSTNPFRDFARPYGILVRKYPDGHLDVAENLNLTSDLLFPLENLQLNSGSNRVPFANWSNFLLSLGSVTGNASTTP